MSPPDLADFAQPEWNDASSVSTALDALAGAHDELSADEAYDRFLWAVGDNHEGTYYPVVLAVLPWLEQLLASGSAWCQRAVMESLIDLGGPFAPAQGHETHEGASVRRALQAFICTLRPRVAPLVESGDARADSAVELLELIDDLAE